MDYYCQHCGNICEVVEESFDYRGTHCNHGRSGIHYTGYYESRCCGADIDIIPPNDEDDYAPCAG